MSYHFRTPTITVELQLRPSPPVDAKPYWWGFNRLSFYLDGEKKAVWEKQIPHELSESTSRPLQVKKAEGDRFGWVLVLVFTHDKARTILKNLGFPEAIEMSPKEIIT